MGNNFETAPSEIGVKIMHSTAFCFRKTSSDERTCRKSKQEFGERNKSKTGQGQQELVGRDFSCTLGTPTAEVDMAKNDEALEINLELLEEKREQAAIREAKSKRQMEKYY
ncbi:reverse transcriptase domain-containing protein, partial [Tanacetum coccineum]